MSKRKLQYEDEEAIVWSREDDQTYTEWLYTSVVQLADIKSTASEHVRFIVLNWMTEVLEEQLADRSTFHLCVLYFDKYLTTHTVDQAQLQCVAIACLMIAIKFVDNYTFTVKEAVDMCASVYTASEIKKTELEILDALDWKLKHGTLYLVFEDIIQHHTLPPIQYAQTMDLLDTILICHYHTIVRIYSARTIVCAALYIVCGNTFNAKLTELLPCVKQLSQTKQMPDTWYTTKFELVLQDTWNCVKDKLEDHQLCVPRTFGE